MNHSKSFTPYHKSDNNFFSFILVLIWAAIATGFGYDMFQKSMNGKLHFTLIVHIHAVAFTGWLVLFSAQTILVRTKNLDLHKKMGLISLGLIPIMIIFGILTVFIVNRRDYGTPDSDLHFICVQFGNLIMFSFLALTGLYLRKNYVVHKRLMIMSTIVLTEPGFSRFLSNEGGFLGYGNFWLIEVLPQFVLLLILGMYDYLTRKQLNKEYMLGVLFFLLVTTIEVFLYYDSRWYNLMKHMIGVV